MVTRDDVIWCYRNVLGRDPESFDVVEGIVKEFRDVKELVKAFFESTEYKARSRFENLGSSDVWLYHNTKYGFLFPLNLEPNFIATHYPTYEEPETDFVVSNLRPGDIAVDMGARFGWFTYAMAQKVGPVGRVFAFDPDTNSTGYVRRGVKINGFTNVEMICAGLGEKEGAGWFQGDFTIGSPGQGEKVPIIRLDDVLMQRSKAVRLIKCDIEGSELLALRGAMAVLSSDHPIILIEVNDQLARKVSGQGFHAVADLLINLDYALFDLAGRAITVRAIQTRIDDGQIFNVTAQAS